MGDRVARAAPFAFESRPPEQHLGFLHQPVQLRDPLLEIQIQIVVDLIRLHHQELGLGGLHRVRDVLEELHVDLVGAQGAGAARNGHDTGTCHRRLGRNARGAEGEVRPPPDAVTVRRMDNATEIVADWVDALTEQFGADGLPPFDRYAAAIDLVELAQRVLCPDLEERLRGAQRTHTRHRPRSL